MMSERWNVALERCGLTLPVPGAVVLNAELDRAFDAFAQPLCVSPNASVHQGLAARGLSVAVDPPDGAALALVILGKSKARNFDALAAALAILPPGGWLLVDGAKTSGVESVLKAVRQHLPVEDVHSKSHGKVFWLRRPADLPAIAQAWRAAPSRLENGYVTGAGMFSADGADPGSELLVALAPPLKGRGADFGSGWGFLAGEILREQDTITQLDLIEVDHPSHLAAQDNVTDARARFHWADATRYRPEEPYDFILSNPPFHTSRAADPSLGRSFIAAAAAALKPSGRFFMVANRHLPYESALKEVFGTGRMLAEMQGYKLYEAAKPKRSTKRSQ